METCDHEPCTQPTTTTTTNTSAFNDTSRHIGDKNWIQQVSVGLSSSFPVNYTCYHYTTVGKYRTLCVQTVEWCQLAWGTMETRFVYFLIVEWTLHSACFTSTSMIHIYILGARLMSFKKIKTYFNVTFWIILQSGHQKARWSHQVERGIILFQV